MHGCILANSGQGKTTLAMAISKLAVLANKKVIYISWGEPDDPRFFHGSVDGMEFVTIQGLSLSSVFSLIKQYNDAAVPGERVVIFIDSLRPLVISASGVIGEKGVNRSLGLVLTQLTKLCPKVLLFSIINPMESPRNVGSHYEVVSSSVDFVMLLDDVSRSEVFQDSFRGYLATGTVATTVRYSADRSLFALSPEEAYARIVTSFDALASFNTSHDVSAIPVAVAVHDSLFDRVLKLERVVNVEELPASSVPLQVNVTDEATDTLPVHRDIRDDIKVFVDSNKELSPPQLVERLLADDDLSLSDAELTYILNKGSKA